MKNGYPESFAEALSETAEWLDLADRAFAELAIIRGVVLPVGDGPLIQEGLRSVVTFLSSTEDGREIDYVLYNQMIGS